MFNQYKRKYYSIAVRDDNDFDNDFTSKIEALKYGKSLIKKGYKNVELWIWGGEEDDEHAVYIDTIKL
jgi:hypothetical protein